MRLFLVLLSFCSVCQAQMSLQGGAALGASWTTAYFTNVTSGLVGWWKFDEGTGVVANDSSGNGNTGYLTNSPTWTNGVMGSAVCFESAPKELAASPSPMSITSTQVSVAAWVKVNNTNGTQFPRVICWSDNAQSAQIVLDSGSGGTALWLTKHTQWQTATSGTKWGQSPAINQWYHLVSVWDSVNNTTVFYTNGVASSGTAYPAGLGAGPAINKVIFNARSDYLNATFGQISLDDVRIYNRALSATEVWILYNWRP